MDILQRVLNFMAFLLLMVSDSPAYSRKKAMMLKTKQNRIKLLSRTRDSRSPYQPSAIVGVWGPDTKPRSLSSGQRQSAGSGGRRVMPRGSLRSLKWSWWWPAAVIYLQGGQRQRQRPTEAGGWGSGLGKWTTNKMQVKVPDSTGSHTEGSVNNYSESAIKLSLFCSALSLAMILLEYLRMYPFPCAVWLRLNRFCIQRSWATPCPRNVGRARGDDTTLWLHFLFVFTGVVNICWNTCT